VGRHHAALVLEIDELGTSQRIRKPDPVMQGGVHVAVWRVKPADPYGRLVIELITDLKTLEVGAHMTIGPVSNMSSARETTRSPSFGAR